MSEKRVIGPVSKSAAAGAGVGYAVAEIVVWGLAQPPMLIDASPIQAALGLVLTVLGGLLGGKISKPTGGGDHVAR
ncbi:hypothetical protein [Glutamicibacter sp. NPDC087673]|uniref:hypothetical protein n=1 Tax=Glutamicibacter sp. NPDC087673 TaxID=3363997 RepID=UPI0038040C38